MALGIATVVPNSTGTAPPRLAAPPRATDCHIHIYDLRFQPPVTKPANGSVADYRKLQQRLGVERVVIVQPRNYGTDNSATLDAIAQLGIANARGVGVLRPDVADAELKRLDAGGIRGIRFTTANPETAVVRIDMIEPLAARIAPLGWHVQLNMPPDDIVAHAAMLRRLPCPIVFDHMAMLVMPAGTRHPAFAVVRELLVARRAWAKISGAYHISKSGPPDYADAAAVAGPFIDAAPDRLVWGTDWPHPSAAVKPDDAAVFDLLPTWTDAATLHRILVKNPEALYGFPA